MAKEICQQVLDTTQWLGNKLLLGVSAIVGLLLGAIGYPKEILLFILTLIIIDLFTKQYSIVVRNYRAFSLKLYFQGWIDRHLTSRQLKNGIGVKAILYLPVLYCAHKSSIIAEISFIGSIISNAMYTLLVLVEMASIFENFIDCGHRELIPFLRVIKNKQNELLEETKGEDNNG